MMIELLLNKLITEYAENKSKLDVYKKLCDTENSKIKEIMLDNDLKSHEADEYSAVITTRKKTEINEDKLIDELKQLGITHLIKTKEVVDMDELEKSLYSGEVSAEQLSNCIKEKEIFALSVKKRGENK